MQLVKHQELSFYEGTTRKVNNFCAKQINRRKEIGRKAYDYIGINCFNELSVNIRKRLRNKDFKKRLTEHLIS